PIRFADPPKVTSPAMLSSHIPIKFPLTHLTRPLSKRQERGTGPRFYRAGRLIRYRTQDIDH
ncbi:MAG: hypothetical protein WBD89_09095, partial [Candidatus Sulfotelmatobacter sp.]